MPLIQSFSSFPPAPHNQSADFTVTIGGNLSVRSAGEHSHVYNVKIGGNLNVRSEIIYSIPAPIEPEIDAGAFLGQIYTARLRDNLGNEILITDAFIDQPAGEVGEKVGLTIARKDIGQISIDKTFTFDIGVWASLSDAIAGNAPAWETILSGGRINSRAYGIGRRGKLPADTLVFDSNEAAKNKLNQFPPRNFILYDNLRTEVNLNDAERTYTSDGDYIKTTANAIPNLNFYKILSFVKDRLGFASFETEIPNFPVIRADFLFNQSYRQVLAGIAGMYEPVFSVQSGNILRIQTKFAALSDGFEPQEITIQNYSQLDLSIPQSTHVDGASIVYLDTSTEADSFTDRIVQTQEETGTFGNSDYTLTEITRTYRDWYNSDNPNLILRTELISEVHETYNNALEKIGQETNVHTYDAQGKRTNSHREIEARVPDLDNSGTPALLTVREENQSVFYTTDARNPRRQFQSKIITQISGLISIDSTNQYFEADFKQDFLEAHKAGNLTASMTSEFGLIKTVTETLTPLGNNQFEVRTQTTDHLRNSTTNAISEPRTGDASLNAVGGRQRRFILWADGVSINARTGGEIIEISVGELPLRFAEELAERILFRRVNGFQEGSVIIPGYHQSLKRGVYFRIFDRDGNNLGRFMATGVRVDMREIGTRRQTVLTTAQIVEV